MQFPPEVVSRLAEMVSWCEWAGIPVSNYLDIGEVKRAGLIARCAGIKTQAHYERVIWGAILDLYNGGDEFGFIDTMTIVIREQLTKAWREGMKAAEVEPSEAGPDDWAELDRIINNEYDFVLKLAGDVIDERSAEKPNLDKFRARAGLWAQRYTETVNNAIIWFGGKSKFKWEMGATEEHCVTCSALDGIVAWATEWEQSKLRPQNPPNELLNCGGWKCDCSLTPTDERRTRNALGRLIDIAIMRGQ